MRLTTSDYGEAITRRPAHRTMTIQLGTRFNRRANVFLVGAGPGDPGLLTLRAAEVITNAQLLLYDALVSPEIVALAPNDCKKAFVGKRAGVYAMDQQTITDLMIVHSRLGKRVVRLKGGDPFIFGRGAEEAAALNEAGIAFEVVPGVSSVSAVAAYAGIPLTHRGISSSFLVATGHEDPRKAGSQVDWRSIAMQNGTLVVLMALHTLHRITCRLIEEGRAPSTPAAVIENGTLAEQRTVVGTLATIAEDVNEADIRGPAMLIVGEVVRLREKVAWFDRAGSRVYGR